MITRNQLRADRQLMVEQYPHLFAAKGQPKKPLKIGLRADLLRRGVIGGDGSFIAKARIKAALRDYCGGARYAHALAAGGARYDLDGQPCGWVIEETMRQARERIVRCGWQNHGRAAA